MAIAETMDDARVKESDARQQTIYREEGEILYKHPS